MVEVDGIPEQAFYPLHQRFVPGKEVAAVESDGGPAHHLLQQARQLPSPLLGTLDDVQGHEASGVPDVPDKQLKEDGPLAGVHGVGHGDEHHLAGAAAGEAGRTGCVQVETPLQPSQEVFEPGACRCTLGVILKVDAASVLIEAQLPQGTLDAKDASVLL